VERLRTSEKHLLTPLAFQCPACKTNERMLIAWPFWQCQCCGVRLIPADIPTNGHAADPQPLAAPLQYFVHHVLDWSI